MFNSFKDLNDQFSQFTSKLTLDSLQDQEANKNDSAVVTQKEHIAQEANELDPTSQINENYKILSEKFLEISRLLEEEKLRNSQLKNELYESENNTNALKDEMVEMKKSYEKEVSCLETKIKNSGKLNSANSKNESRNLDRNLNKELKEKIQSLEEDLIKKEQLISYKEDLIFELKNKKSELDSTETENLKSEIANLLSSNEQQASTIHQLECKMEEKNRQLQEILDSQDDFVKSLHAKIDHLQSENLKISNELEDNKQIKNTLQKKALETVKALKKANAQEEDYKHQLEAIKNKLNQKESELLSMHLKYENLEKTHNDVREEVAELETKNAASRKEISRLSELVEELNSKASEELSTHQSTESQLEDLKKENQRLKEGISDLESKLQESEERHSADLMATKDSFSKQLSEAQRLSEQLKLDISHLEEDLEMHRASSDNLDEYKRKAQLALKKTNHSLSQVTSENQSLKEELQEVVSNYNEVLGQLEAKNEEISRTKETLDELNLRYSESLDQNKLLELSSTEMTSLLEAYKESESELKKRIYFLEKEVDDSQHRIKSMELETQNRNEEIERSTPKTVREQSSEKLESKGSFNAHSEAHPGVFPRESLEISSESGNQLYIQEGKPREEIGFVSEVDSRIQNRNQLLLGNTFDLNEESSQSNHSILLVSELQAKLDLLRKELSSKSKEIDDLHALIQYEKKAKTELSKSVEELKAFIERTKKLNEGPNSVINMEYLKNCIYKYMASLDWGEKKTLLPVISTILKFTKDEQEAIQNTISDMQVSSNEIGYTLNSLGNIAGSLWGSSG